MNDYKNELLLVSVFVITYNHEKYIKQALDGILMQEVDFNYEVIIGDDASTDNTTKVLKQYAEKFPDKIKLILHENNIGIHANINSVWKECKGKYIASCEGDDFWVLPNKLKKQVEFLEKNKSYIATTHDFEIINEHDQIIAPSTELKHYFTKNHFTIEEIEKGFMPGQTATLVYRNIFIDNKINTKPLLTSKVIGDRKLTLFLTLYGNIYRFDEIMSYYRRVVTHGDSWSASVQGKNMNLYNYNIFKEIFNDFEQKSEVVKYIFKNIPLRIFQNIKEKIKRNKKLEG